jgi:predicted nucleotidyltransferase
VSADLFREFGSEYPALGQIASVYSDDRIRGPVGFDWDPPTEKLIVTFEGLVTRTPFISRMQALLRVLREKMGVPVDIEFASDGRDLYLLQCRPQSFSRDAVAGPSPRDIPAARVLFTPTATCRTAACPRTRTSSTDLSVRRGVGPSELKEIGRAVGKLNKLLPKRQFVLMGPGRWGSRGDIKLGVSVTYSDINNTAVLMEVATRRGNYTPDLSFGTHFFQDLVEAGIRYLPLYPGEDDVTFNELFLKRAPNILADLLPEHAHLAATLRVIDVMQATGSQVLRVLMNADLDQAVGFLATPVAAAETVTEKKRTIEPAPEDHWRWRLNMAERIAGELDTERFGVVAMYVFGSAKNATSGPGSDIDLIVHVRGSDEQRRALETWFEGWSLCLAEMNYLRTGYKSQGLLDVHIITDRDIEEHTSYAVKIGAVTDPARPLLLKKVEPKPAFESRFAPVATPR